VRRRHRAGTNERTQICPKLAVAARTLRSTECSALVIDQNLLEADPATTDVVLNEAETAIPVFVNFAICGIARVVRDVRSALQRREGERLRAVREAEANLRSQLTEALTGILLSSQLAMEVPGPGGSPGALALRLSTGDVHAAAIAARGLIERGRTRDPDLQTVLPWGQSVRPAFLYPPRLPNI
jgi:hypothetical protein